MIERETISPTGTVRYRAVKGWGAFWRSNFESRLTEPAEIEDYAWLADGTGVFFTTERSASVLRWSPEISVRTIPFQTPLVNDVHLLVESPTQNLMTVAWNNQMEAGIELVDFSSDTIVHRAGKGLDFREDTNGISVPVFSSDGDAIGVGFTHFGWWVDWIESDLDPYEDSSPGGEFLAAWIVVGNMNDSTWSQPIEIKIELTKGWKPAQGKEDIFSYSLISAMTFLDNQILQIELFKIGKFQFNFHQTKKFTVDFTS
jgi:hypothetical protein